MIDEHEYLPLEKRYPDLVSELDASVSEVGDQGERCFYAVEHSRIAQLDVD